MDLMVKSNKEKSGLNSFIDFTPYLALAFATNKKLERDIRVIFNTNRQKAHSLLKKSKFNNSTYLFNGNIKRDKRAKESLAVIELLKETKDEERLFKLIKKGWKEAYLAAKDKEEMNIMFLSKNKEIQNIDSDYHDEIQAIIPFLAEKLNKEVHPNMVKTMMLNSIYEIDIYHHSGERPVYGEDDIENQKGENIKNRFRNEFPGINSTDKLDVYRICFENEDFANFISSIDSLFQFEGLSFRKITDNYKIKESDISQYACNYFASHRNQNKEKSTEYIFYSIYLGYTLRAYKDAKKEYFKLLDSISRTASKEEIKYNREKLEKEKNGFKRQAEILQGENNRLKKEYKESIEKENIELRQEIEQLKKEKDELEKEKNNLTETVDSLLGDDEDSNNREDGSSDVSLEEKIDEINTRKTIILGGHTGWHIKMQEAIGDDLVCVRGDNENFDENIMNNRDIVFLYTKFMSHGFYYKVIEKCKRAGIPFDFIKSTSIDYAVHDMYKASQQLTT